MENLAKVMVFRLGDAGHALDEEDFKNDLAVLTEDELSQFCDFVTQMALVANGVCKRRFPERWVRMMTTLSARTTSHWR